MHLKQLLKTTLTIAAIASFFVASQILTAQPTDSSQQQFASTPVGKPGFLPLKITVNPDLKFDKDFIAQLRTNFHWENNSTAYVDSIPAAEPFPDDQPVMCVFIDIKMPDNAQVINVYSFSSEIIEHSYDVLFQKGVLVNTFEPDVKFFYVPQTMLNDKNQTAIWVEIVLSNNQVKRSQPIYLPSLSFLGLHSSFMKSWLFSMDEEASASSQ